MNYMSLEEARRDAKEKLNYNGWSLVLSGPLHNISRKGRLGNDEADRAVYVETYVKTVPHMDYMQKVYYRYSGLFLAV